MQQTINERVILLKKELGLTDIEFCGRASISTSTLNKLKNNEQVTQKVFNSIITAFGVNKDWLYDNKGKMFAEQAKESNTANPWKDALISELKEEVTYYRELLKIMAGAGKVPANFLKALNNAGSLKRDLLRAAA